MTDFEIIEFGYNAADETINFGTRSLAEGDNLYEATTLATLKCAEPSELEVNPHINAVVQDSKIYFSVGTVMRIFEDRQCSSVIFNAKFDSVIDCFCVSAKSEYLLICRRNGAVSLIDCRNEYNSVFTTTCDRDDCADKFFINSFLDNGCFLIVTKQGRVYRMLFHPEFKMECLHEFNFRAEIASCQYPFLLVNSTKLAILNLEKNNTVVDSGRSFKKIFPIACMFLALDFEGNLFRICAISLMIFPVNNSVKYKDILVLSECDRIQIIAVLEDENGQTHIQLLTYEGFSTLFSLKVSNHIHLFSLDSLNDELLYISKIVSNDSVSELRFHVVNETAPEQRFRRLLKKHKYDEAENFAQLFGLDTSLIKKARAEEICEKSLCNSEDIDNLVNLLTAIEDDEFRLQCCVNVESSCDSFDDVRKILTYGGTLELKKQENRALAEDVQNSVMQLLFRLDTFLDINEHPEKVDSSWLQFSSCDLIEEVTIMLRNYEIEKAKIIYSRLDELTTKRLTEQHVSDILSVLDNIPISTYEPFLPVFITVTLSILPFTLPLFVKWTYKKVFYLEKRGKVDFPDNAIRFTENIVGLMKVGDVADNSFQRHRESLVELSSLFATLRTLKKLKDEYRISIPVTDYLSGPQNVVRLLLNVELCPEEYDGFLKRFLCKYMVENHMEPNAILLEEIKDLMKYEECYWTHIIGLILNCISSVRVKLEAVKTILNFATVPWSDTIRKIVNEALEYPNELSAKIRELVNNEPMQIVLRKPKYKFRERGINCLDDLRFVISRLMYCNEPTMVEDVYKVCSSTEFRHEANMMLAKWFIQKGLLEKAMDVVDNNPPEEIFKCAQELAAFVEMVINNELKLPAEQVNNYYNVSGSIFKRLNDNETDNFLRAYNDETLTLIRNVHDLNKHFKIKTETHSLRHATNRNKIVDNVLEDARQLLETGKQTIDQLFTVCDKLSASLSLDKDEIWIKLCDKCDDYNTIITAAQRVCNSEASVKNLCLTAVLLMKYVGTLQLADDSGQSDSERSLVLKDFEDVVDDEIFCKGLALAQEVIAKAVVKAGPEDDANVMEVARWVDTSFYFTRRHDSELKRKLYADIYESGTVMPGILTFSTIKNIFVAFCAYRGLNNPTGGGYLTRFSKPANTEEEFFKELELLPPVLERMSKEGQHFTAYKIIETVHVSLMQCSKPNQTVLTFLEDLLKNQCIPKVLWSTLSNSIIDGNFVFDLLLSCDRDAAAKFIVTSWKMYKRHPRKFASISKIGIRFWDHYGMTSGKREMMITLLNIKWWKKFESKKFQYDSFYKMKPEDRLEFLINTDCLDMKSAKAYCDDYNLSLQNVHKYFFKKVFVNWKPDYEIQVDGNRRHLVVKNSEDDLLKKVYEIIELVDRNYVVEVITNTWNLVNTYYYEVFIAMIHVLTALGDKSDRKAQLAMLFFLKNYNRVSKPTETEIEQWYTNFPDSQSVDPLAEFRLSFTPLLFSKQIFDIIRPELNLKTYKLWFNATDMLTVLTKDQICSFVVKDVVTSGLISKDESNEWVLHPKHEDLFNEIDDCVMNMCDLELATSVVYHLVINSPKGADQVAAAKLCYKYAIQYRKEKPNSSDVEKAVTKVEKKYFTFASTHILYTYQLVEDSYVHLLSQPKELIRALYMNERVLRSNNVGFQCREINKAAEAIADLYNVDIKKIRHNLILNYLHGDQSSPLDFDLTLNSATNEECSEDENLNRIAYVCCSDDVQYWRTQLLEIGTGEDSEEQRSVHSKTKALKVFVMISDAETIMSMTQLSFDEFRNYIDKITVVSNLQYLGISLTVESLDQYSKKELLKRLVTRTGHILAIKTMALIAMTYKIYNVNYWQFIISKSISFSLFDELRTYVNFLKKTTFFYKSFYINAWQQLIDNSLTQLKNSNGLHQALLSIFLMIQSCPVLHSLNLDKAFKRCMDMDKPEFAAVLLQYLDTNRRGEYVKQIRNSNKDLVASLNNLDQNGLWGISYVKTILAEK